MALDDLISSKGKLKILKLLFKVGQANISYIARETHLNHSLVEKHLEDLVRAGIVVERRYGRMRIFMVDMKNPRVSGLSEILRQLENL